jgi:valine--pyruvate aminotransferase
MLSKERVLNEETGIGPKVGGVVFSRPNNPCGNILTDREVDIIVSACREYHIPVFIDSAYAPPYPALNNVPMSINCGNGVVHCMSLSKVGLPGERVGVAIGDPQTIEVLEAFQTNACIHSSRFGQAIAALAIKSGLLAELAHNVVRPFYARKIALIDELLDSYFQNLFPWYLHQGDGGLFAWIWCKDLPISDRELYEKGKEYGVLIVPGSAFFPGLNNHWQHASECFRISLTASNEELVEGIKRLSFLIKGLYC